LNAADDIQLYQAGPVIKLIELVMRKNIEDKFDRIWSLQRNFLPKKGWNTYG